jgi:phage portal protein BeeE
MLSLSGAMSCLRRLSEAIVEWPVNILLGAQQQQAEDRQTDRPWRS